MFFCSSVRSKFMCGANVTLVASASRVAAYGRRMSSERGQASVEWVVLLLFVSLVFGTALAFVPAFDGRPLGAALARAIVCAVRGDCGSDAALRSAYGDRTAGVVRADLPSIVYEHGTLTLPVDYRACRSHRCSDAPDDRDLDAHRTRSGKPATVFTHVVRRGGRAYVQYWFNWAESIISPAQTTFPR